MKNAPAMTWDRLEAFAGPTLIEDARSVTKNSPRGDALFRRFLEWLLLSEKLSDIRKSGNLVDDVSGHVLNVAKMYRTADCGDISRQEASSLVASAVSLWLDYEERREVSGEYRRKAQGIVGKVLGHFGQMTARNYPSYGLSLLKSPPTLDSAKRVGLKYLNWPSIKQASKDTADAHSLAVVRDAAIEIFEQGETIFQWRRSLSDYGFKSNVVERSARAEISALINSVEAELVATGVPTLQHRYWDAMDPVLWKKAGFPFDLGTRKMPFRRVQALVFQSLGASIRVTAAVKIIFTCDTGWNKEQVTELTECPYAFRTEDRTALADRVYLAMFKERAGHFLHALLERNPNSSLSLEDKMALLEEGAESDSDGYLLLPSDSSLIAILDRYQRLTEPLRSFDKAGRFSGHFFVAAGQSGLTLVEDTIFALKLGGVLDCDGISYRAIRKTRINVTRRETGSLGLTKILTDHRDIKTILTHYDDPDIRAELDEAVLFFFNCIQVAVVAGHTEALPSIGLTFEDFEWFKHLSKICGLTAAFQITERRLAVADRYYLEFTPDLDTLIGIYIIRRAAIAQGRAANDSRWRAQIMPILGFVNALRRHVFEKGFGPTYETAVQIAFRGLRTGNIVLPSLLGN